MKAACSKRYIKRYVNEGHDAVTAKQMKDASTKLFYMFIVEKSGS